MSIIKKGLISNLIYAAKDNNYELKREAVWTISNICVSIYDNDAIRDLLYADVLTLFYDILAYQ